ncbi:hypothetical protein FRX31_030295, partial [Thalictrum thalictroides]
AFKRLQKKDEDFKTNPSTDEWELAREICKCLQIFYVSTMSLPDASICSIPDDIDSMANDELNDDDDYCSTIGIYP